MSLTALLPRCLSGPAAFALAASSAGLAQERAVPNDEGRDLVVASLAALPGFGDAPLVVRISARLDGAGPPDLTEVDRALEGTGIGLVLVHEAPNDEVRAWARRWGRTLPDTVARCAGGLRGIDDLLERSDRPARDRLRRGESDEAFVVLDREGRVVAVQHDPPSPEYALAVLDELMAGRDSAAQAEMQAEIAELLHASTRGDRAKARLDRRIDEAIRRAPSAIDPYMARYRLLMMTTPGRPARERALVDTVFERFADRPARLARFVLSALVPWSDFNDVLARQRPALDDACARHPDSRALERARLHSALAATDVATAVRSAMRLTELAKADRAGLAELAFVFADAVRDLAGSPPPGAPEPGRRGPRPLAPPGADSADRDDEARRTRRRQLRVLRNLAENALALAGSAEDPAPALARVQLLLRLGDEPAAAGAAGSALDLLEGDVELFARLGLAATIDRRSPAAAADAVSAPAHPADPGDEDVWIRVATTATARVRELPGWQESAAAVRLTAWDLVRSGETAAAIRLLGTAPFDRASAQGRAATDQRDRLVLHERGVQHR